MYVDLIGVVKVGVLGVEGRSKVISLSLSSTIYLPPKTSPQTHKKSSNFSTIPESRNENSDSDLPAFTGNLAMRDYLKSFMFCLAGRMQMGHTSWS
jgi:hypothetical protein